MSYPAVTLDRLYLLDVQNHKCLYNFLNSLQLVDMTFVINRKTILKYKLQRIKTLFTLRNLLENYRNHFKTIKALINYNSSHEAFATLNDQLDLSEKKPSRDCLCEKIHSFKDCLYLIIGLRASD